MRLSTLEKTLKILKAAGVSTFRRTDETGVFEVTFPPPEPPIVHEKVSKEAVAEAAKKEFMKTMYASSEGVED